jgi:hypothetical protein
MPCTNIPNKLCVNQNLISLYIISREYSEVSIYSSPSIIRMIKSRRMRLTGHVARMGGRGMHIGYWWESQKERDHWEDQDVGG